MDEAAVLVGDSWKPFPDWQQRVYNEKAELDAKIAKLSKFIMKDGDFHQLDYMSRDLMKLQLTVMRNYSDVLNQRIILFGV